MKTYLVGGAVRDNLLGLPVKDKDWVVVGATPKEMLDLRYQQVGKDFPVFLHPETKEEYALARTEKKTGLGHSAFSVDAAPTITIEEDLLRRDLTINAMAIDEDGTLIDPYGGQEDLSNKILRHVSPAFSEDPLRVLRVARFSARFAHLGFEVAQETLELMQHLVNNSELTALTAERVWNEVQRALSEKTPAFFFLTLRECYGLGIVMPEIESLWGVSQEKAQLSLMALTKAAELTPDTAIRFSALCYELPIVHEFTFSKNLQKLENLCRRLKTPNDHKDLASITCLYCDTFYDLSLDDTEGILNLLEKTDSFRRSERFQFFLIACKAISKAKGLSEDSIESRNNFLLEALTLCQDVDASSLNQQGFKGKEIGEQLRLLRLQTLKILTQDDS